MTEFHFRSMEAPHSECDVTKQFEIPDFILAVCTCFVHKCRRFEVIRDFRLLNHGGIPLPVDGSTAEQKSQHAR
jgi:hypothetical protein